MSERDPLHVAIDGPAGSGKSTVARALAQRLGLTHVDTGAMYRALTLVAQREGIALDAAGPLARRLRSLDLRFLDGALHLGRTCVETDLRSEAVTAAVSQVSAHAAVRAAMVQRQRDLCWGAPGGVVMEGRDIGSVVLPLARCKIHLDASLEERARRRARQAGLSLEAETLARTATELGERDAKDSTREASPLLVSPDAHVVDTTSSSFDAVVETCARLAREADRPPAPGALHRADRFQHPHYWMVHAGIGPILRGLAGLQVMGAGHQDEPGSYLYACNHVSNFDPLMVGFGVDREVHFLAKRELFFPPLGWMIRAFNAIPIVRGRYDPVAFDQALGALRSGRSLVIFPEGTRRRPGRPGPIKKGLALLAVASGRPYVPCFVWGTHTFGSALARRVPLQLWIGPPVRLHALEHLRRTLGDGEIHERIGALYLQQLHAFLHRCGCAATSPPEPGATA